MRSASVRLGLRALLKGGAYPFGIAEVLDGAFAMEAYAGVEVGLAGMLVLCGSLLSRTGRLRCSEH